MCLILDANKYGDFRNPEDEDMQPVKQWVEKNGKIVYARTPKLERELGKDKVAKRLFEEYRKRGKLKLVNVADVERAESNLTSLASDDGHIIALAQISGAKLLVSADARLHQDFKNKNNITGGKVYQSKRHRNLLKVDICP